MSEEEGNNDNTIIIEGHLSPGYKESASMKSDVDPDVLSTEQVASMVKKCDALELQLCEALTRISILESSLDKEKEELENARVLMAAKDEEIRHTKAELEASLNSLKNPGSLLAQVGSSFLSLGEHEAAVQELEDQHVSQLRTIKEKLQEAEYREKKLQIQETKLRAELESAVASERAAQEALVKANVDKMRQEAEAIIKDAETQWRVAYEERMTTLLDTHDREKDELQRAYQSRCEKMRQQYEEKFEKAREELNESFEARYFRQVAELEAQHAKDLLRSRREVSLWWERVDVLRRKSLETLTSVRQWTDAHNLSSELSAAREILENGSISAPLSGPDEYVFSSPLNKRLFTSKRTEDLTKEVEGRADAENDLKNATSQSRNPSSPKALHGDAPHVDSDGAASNEEDVSLHSPFDTPFYVPFQDLNAEILALLSLLSERILPQALSSVPSVSPLLSDSQPFHEKISPSPGVLDADYDSDTSTEHFGPPILENGDSAVPSEVFTDADGSYGVVSVSIGVDATGRLSVFDSTLSPRQSRSSSCSSSCSSSRSSISAGFTAVSVDSPSTGLPDPVAPPRHSRPSNSNEEGTTAAVVSQEELEECKNLVSELEERITTLLEEVAAAKNLAKGKEIECEILRHEQAEQHSLHEVVLHTKDSALSAQHDQINALKHSLFVLASRLQFASGKLAVPQNIAASPLTSEHPHPVSSISAEPEDVSLLIEAQKNLQSLQQCIVGSCGKIQGILNNFLQETNLSVTTQKDSILARLANGSAADKTKVQDDIATEPSATADAGQKVEEVVEPEVQDTDHSDSAASGVTSTSPDLFTTAAPEFRAFVSQLESLLVPPNIVSSSNEVGGPSTPSSLSPASLELTRGILTFILSSTDEARALLAQFAPAIAQKSLTSEPDTTDSDFKPSPATTDAPINSSTSDATSAAFATSPKSPSYPAGTPISLEEMASAIERLRLKTDALPRPSLSFQQACRELLNPRNPYFPAEFLMHRHLVLFKILCENASLSPQLRVRSLAEYLASLLPFMHLCSQEQEEVSKCLDLLRSLPDTESLGNSVAATAAACGASPIQSTSVSPQFRPQRASSRDSVEKATLQDQAVPTSSAASDLLDGTSSPVKSEGAFPSSSSLSSSASPETSEVPFTSPTERMAQSYGRALVSLEASVHVVSQAVFIAQNLMQAQDTIHFVNNELLEQLEGLTSYLRMCEKAIRATEDGYYREKLLSTKFNALSQELLDKIQHFAQKGMEILQNAPQEKTLVDILSHSLLGFDEKLDDNESPTPAKAQTEEGTPVGVDNGVKISVPRALSAPQFRAIPLNRKFVSAASSSLEMDSFPLSSAEEAMGVHSHAPTVGDAAVAPFPALAPVGSSEAISDPFEHTNVARDSLANAEQNGHPIDSSAESPADSLTNSPAMSPSLSATAYFALSPSLPSSPSTTAPPTPVQGNSPTNIQKHSPWEGLVQPSTAAIPVVDLKEEQKNLEQQEMQSPRAQRDSIKEAKERMDKALRILRERRVLVDQAAEQAMSSQSAQILSGISSESVAPYVPQTPQMQSQLYQTVGGHIISPYPSFQSLHNPRLNSNAIVSPGHSAAAGAVFHTPVKVSNRAVHADVQGMMQPAVTHHSHPQFQASLSDQPFLGSPKNLLPTAAFHAAAITSNDALEVLPFSPTSTDFRTPVGPTRGTPFTPQSLQAPGSHDGGIAMLYHSPDWNQSVIGVTRTARLSEFGDTFATSGAQRRRAAPTFMGEPRRSISAFAGNRGEKYVLVNGHWTSIDPFNSVFAYDLAAERYAKEKRVRLVAQKNEIEAMETKRRNAIVTSQIKSSHRSAFGSLIPLPPSLENPGPEFPFSPNILGAPMRRMSMISPATTSEYTRVTYFTRSPPS